MSPIILYNFPVLVLTGNEEYDEDLAEVRDRVEVSVADSGGGDAEEVDAVGEPELARRPRVLVVVERVSLILENINQTGAPQQESNNHREQLCIKV